MNGYSKVIIGVAACTLALLTLWKCMSKKKVLATPQSLCSTTPISALCTGRYEHLSPYFTDLELKDLDDLTDNLLLQFVPENHRPLALLFVRRELSKAKFVWKQNDGLKPRKFSNEHKRIVVMENGLLNLSRMLVSSQFEYGKPDMISITELADLLQRHLKNQPTVKWLRMSNCNLVDADIPFVVDILTELSSCEIVDLSWNRFCGRDKLKDMVDVTISKLCGPSSSLKFLILHLPRLKVLISLRANQYVIRNWFLFLENGYWLQVLLLGVLC
jgi:hypothetical protein